MDGAVPHIDRQAGLALGALRKRLFEIGGSRHFEGFQQEPEPTHHGANIEAQGLSPVTRRPVCRVIRSSQEVVVTARRSILPEKLVATVQGIAARHGVSSIRVFGSVARGEQRKDSDLDLLVDIEPGRSLLDLVAFVQDLEEALACRVDAVTEKALSPYLRDRILAEALPL